MKKKWKKIKARNVSFEAHARTRTYYTYTPFETHGETRDRSVKRRYVNPILLEIDFRRNDFSEVKRKSLGEINMKR